MDLDCVWVTTLEYVGVALESVIVCVCGAVAVGALTNS